MSSVLVMLCFIVCSYVSCLSFQGLKFEVIPSKFEETLDKSSFSSPQAYVVENARQKTLEVMERLRYVSSSE